VSLWFIDPENRADAGRHGCHLCGARPLWEFDRMQRGLARRASKKTRNRVGSAPLVSRAARNMPCMAGRPPFQSNSANRAGGLTPDPCMGEILWTQEPELPRGTQREEPGTLHLPLLETGEGLAHCRALRVTLLDRTIRDFGSRGEAVTGLPLQDLHATLLWAPQRYATTDRGAALSALSILTGAGRPMRGLQPGHLIGR